MCSSESIVIAARGSPDVCHSGTAARSSRRRRPSRTSTPTAACRMLFAIDQEGCTSSGPTPSA